MELHRADTQSMNSPAHLILSTPWPSVHFSSTLFTHLRIMRACKSGCELNKYEKNRFNTSMRFMRTLDG